jgi:hypothetical protein
MFASGLQTALLQGVQHCRSPLGAGVEPRSPHAARRRDVSRWRGPVFPDRRFTVAMIGLGAADPKASPIALHGRIRFGTASRRLSAVRLWTWRWMNPNSAAARVYADYQVPAPRQICLLPHIADMFRAALEFVGGSASRRANSLAVTPPTSSCRHAVGDGVGARPYS